MLRISPLFKLMIFELKMPFLVMSMQKSSLFLFKLEDASEYALFIRIPFSFLNSGIEIIANCPGMKLKSFGNSRLRRTYLGDVFSTEIIFVSKVSISMLVFRFNI